MPLAFPPSEEKRAADPPHTRVVATSTEMDFIPSALVSHTLSLLPPRSLPQVAAACRIFLAAIPDAIRSHAAADGTAIDFALPLVEQVKELARGAAVKAWRNGAERSWRMFAGSTYGNCVAIHDGRVAVMGSSETEEANTDQGVCYIRSLDDGAWQQQSFKLADVGSYSNSLCSVALDGDAIALGASGRVHVWSLRTNEFVATFSAGSMGWVFALALHGDLLVCGGYYENALYKWSISKRERSKLTGHSKTVYEIAASSEAIVSASDDHSARVWDRQDGLQIGTLPHPASVLSVSHDRGTAVTGCRDGLVRTWSMDVAARTFAVTRVLRHGLGPEQCAALPASFTLPAHWCAEDAVDGATAVWSVSLRDDVLVSGGGVVAHVWSLSGVYQRSNS